MAVDLRRLLVADPRGRYSYMQDMLLIQACLARVWLACIFPPPSNVSQTPVITPRTPRVFPPALLAIANTVPSPSALAQDMFCQLKSTALSSFDD